MQFVLLLYSDQSGWFKLTPEEQAKWTKAYEKYFQALEKARVLVSANHLESSSKTETVRVRGSKAVVAKGPLVKSKIQLAGYFIIQVANRRVALQWAKKHPAAKHGSIEVRALGVPPVSDE